MTVTQIIPITKSRSKIYVDQELAFVLYKGELRLYHVREGEEIPPEDCRRIFQEVLPKRARLRAMNLLKNREYTTSQLRAKLKEGFYPQEAIEDALEYVASFHYTDDLRYAVDFITCHEYDRSRMRIEQDLLRRGISREILEKAWLEWEDKGGIQDEQSMILELLAKRRYDPESADKKEQQRTYAYLMRKGFSGEQIRRALGLF